MAIDIEQFLKSVKVFADLTDEELKELVTNSELVTYYDGDIIKRSGEISRFLMVIYEGKVDIISYKEGIKKRIATIETGDIVGEMSICTGEPNFVDVVSVGKCKVVKIKREVCTGLLLKNPKTMAKIAQTITKRLVYREMDEALAKYRRESFGKVEDPYDLDFSSAVDPIKILVVNCRITSVRYTLFDTSKKEPIIGGIVDKINSDTGKYYKFQTNEGVYERPHTVKTLRDAIRLTIVTMIDPELGVIKDIKEIRAVGHRVVHGGDKFYSSSVINPEVLVSIREASPMAPMHNPYNIEGIELLMSLLPDATHVAVCDTAFHKTMPQHAYQYALSSNLNKQSHIRRYGFHGTNHSYVALMAAMLLKKPVDKLKIISCHLGHGASMCAIDHGRSIDISMGMTPLEGLVMGSRCGDVDPGILIYLASIGYTATEISRILNEESGIKGLSGISGYMKDVYEEAEKGNTDAENAIKIFCYKIKKYIGSYIAVLGGFDVLIFTGGIGVNSPGIRTRVCQGLEHFGIAINDELNKHTIPTGNNAVDITNLNSKIRIIVVPPNETRMIARETLSAMGRFRSKEEIEEYRKKPIPVNISAHHVHVNKEAFEVLFGKGKTLNPRSPLSQPGQYASEETVNLIGPKGRIDKVRILGPFRKECQVEISRTEEFKLGIDAPKRDSGDIDGTPGIILEGPNGQYKIEKGVIFARRHIHMSPSDALSYGLRDRDVVTIRIVSDRSLTFDDVLIRVHPDFLLDMHVDTDEANAALIVNPPALGYLEGIQSRQYT
ncbi:MAG: acetate/propionate family kinase [Candidatus Magnetoovum sp. WYHC-5]|nr:acetate/propionate family kinase [Candidatus Magnetoovum sp. WYHC-5]